MLGTLRQGCCILPSDPALKQPASIRLRRGSGRAVLLTWGGSPARADLPGRAVEPGSPTGAMVPAPLQWQNSTPAPVWQAGISHEFNTWGCFDNQYCHFFLHIEVDLC